MNEIEKFLNAEIGSSDWPYSVWIDKAKAVIRRHHNFTTAIRGAWPEGFICSEAAEDCDADVERIIKGEE